MRKTALGIVLLLVLAGCNGVVAPDSPPQSSSAESPTTPDRVNVTTDGVGLGDVNATKVWHRVGRLVTVEPPDAPTVEVRSRPPNGTAHAGSFERSFGVENWSYTTHAVFGYYDSSENTAVVLRTSETNETTVERVLAHEFVHAYQDRLDASLPENASRFARAAVSEGSARYVEWQYTRTYLDGGAATPADGSFQDASTLERLGDAPYHLGALYLHDHGNATAPLRSLFENPTTTAEQVLHGLEAGGEPPRELAVHGDPGDGWEWDSERVERRGEAELRFLLEVGLPRDRAATAADGWGNDQWTRFEAADGDGYAWVIRWDSPGEADEFETAFADFRANVSEPLAIERVGTDTTVVFSGHEAFVENATASGTAVNVTVAA